MKKLIPVFAVAIMSTIAFTSCSGKKDYTCSCSINGTATSSVTIHAKKSDAQAACPATQTATSGGVTITSTCTLN